MRVLHVTRDFPPRINGGLSTAVGGMVRASVEAGLTCRVISFDAWRPSRPSAAPAHEEHQLGAEVIRVSAPDQLDHARAFAGPVDVVHVHDALLWPFAESLDAPRRVYTVHFAQGVVAALRGLGDRPPASLLAEERALAAADRVTIPSPGLADHLAVASDRLRLVPLAVHPEAPQPRQPTPGRVLFAGRFADLKGLAELPSALARLRASGCAAELVIAGGLPDSPKRDRRWRRRLAAAEPEGLSLIGWLDPEALRREHARAAVFVAPSWFETFGLSVLEAMQRGVPVVATRTPGVTSILRHGVTGLLTPPRDPEALAEALEALLRDPARAERMGRAAAADVAARWLWSHRVDALRAAYLWP